MAERVAVIGVGQTEFMSKNMEISQSELVNVAVRRALETLSWLSRILMR